MNWAGIMYGGAILSVLIIIIYGLYYLFKDILNYEKISKLQNKKR